MGAQGLQALAVAAAMKKLESFSCLQLVQLAEQSSPTVLVKLETCTLRRLAGFTTEHLARLLQAAAKAKFHSNAFTSKLVSKLEGGAKSTAPIWLTVAIEALGSLGQSCAALCHATVQATTPQLDQLDAAVLARLAYALAAHGVQSQFVAKLLAACLPKLVSGSPSAAVDLLRTVALSGAQLAASEAFAALEGRLDVLEPAQLAGLSWAMATTGADDALFLGKLVAECRSKLGAFGTDELINLSWAINHKWHEMAKQQTETGKAVHALAQLVNKQLQVMGCI